MSPFIASSLTTVMKPETEASMNIELNRGVMLTGTTASECRMEQLASLVMKAKCPPVISPVHHMYYRSVSVYTTHWCTDILFCSLAVIDPRIGHAHDGRTFSNYLCPPSF